MTEGPVYVDGSPAGRFIVVRRLSTEQLGEYPELEERAVIPQAPSHPAPIVGGREGRLRGNHLQMVAQPAHDRFQRLRGFPLRVRDPIPQHFWKFPQPFAASAASGQPQNGPPGPVGQLDIGLAVEALARVFLKNPALALDKGAPPDVVIRPGFEIPQRLEFVIHGEPFPRARQAIPGRPEREEPTRMAQESLVRGHFEHGLDRPRPYLDARIASAMEWLVHPKHVQHLLLVRPHQHQLAGRRLALHAPDLVDYVFDRWHDAGRRGMVELVERHDRALHQQLPDDVREAKSGAVGTVQTRHVLQQRRQTIILHLVGQGL